MHRQLTVLIFLFALASAIFASEKAEFNVATYNIRMQNDNDSLAGNVWGTRFPVIANLARFHGTSLS